MTLKSERQRERPLTQFVTQISIMKEFVKYSCSLDYNMMLCNSRKNAIYMA